MKTTYYCPKCNIRFNEEGTPNINKKHMGCGEYMQIEEAEGEESK